MDYDKALGYLYGLQHFGVKLGLTNIERLVEHFGHPERAFPSVHVAGTNGKGSVAAMTASCLRASGLRTGLYTSPHLEHFEERITVQGRPIPRGRVAELTARVRDGVATLLADGVIEHHPTFFEIVTALAFLYFRECRVDAAVVEVGLGGRFDATNVITPEVSVITRLDIDHARHLGATLSSIAFEKAGIIKPGVPVVTGAQDGEAMGVLHAIAGERSSPLIVADDGACTMSRMRPLDPCTLSIESGGLRLRSLTLPLRGNFQASNALLALRAATEFAQMTGRSFTEKALRDGIQQTRWPGRLELVLRRPAVLLDCGHNPAAARRAAEYVDSIPARKRTLVFALMKDKDLSGVAEALWPRFDRILLTQPAYERAMDPFIMRERVGLARGIEVHPNPRKAVAEGFWALGPEDLLFVAGSCFLIGEVRGFLINLVGPSPDEA